MTRTYRKKTLADYPPEFFEVWKQAVAGTLRLEFPSKGSATNFKHRLNSFRRAFGAESGDLATSSDFYKVDLMVTETPDGKGLIQPYVQDWKKQLAAGAALGGQLVSPPTLTPLAAPAPSGQGPEKQALDKALSNLGFGTGEQK